MMHKGIKILFSVLSSLLLCVIILPLAVAMLLSVPAIQNFVVQRVTSMLSDKIGTTVAVDKISLEKFNFLTADGLYVEDMGGDTLLYVGKMSANLNTLGLLKGDLSVSDIACDKALVNLHRHDGKVNLSILLDKLSGDKTKAKKGGTQLHLSNVSLVDSRFVYDDSERETTSLGMDYTDLDLRELNVKSRRIDILGDSIAMELHDLSLRDHSGVEIRNLAADCFSLKGSNLYFNNLKLASQGSELNLPILSLEAEDWHKYKYFTDSVKMTAESDASLFSFETLRYYAPSFKRDIDVVLRDLSFAIHGTVNDMYGELTDASCGAETKLAVVFDIFGVTELKNARFVFNGLKASTNGRDIAEIYSGATGNVLSDNVIRVLERAGYMNLNAFFEGAVSNFKAEGELLSQAGSIGFNGRIQPTGNGVSDYSGRVTIDDVAAGRLLDVENLGNVSFTGNVGGVMSQKRISATVEASVSKLDFMSYPYHDITLSGLLVDKAFDGEVVGNDPNAEFTLDGKFDFGQSIPRYDFNLDLRNADLCRLHLNQRDTVSVVSGRLEASGAGNTFDDFNGKAVLSDLLYISPTDSVATGRIEMVGRNNELSKFLSLNSSFMDVEYKSPMSYKQIFEYFKETLLGYVPSISDRLHEHEHKQADEGVTLADTDYSLLKFNVKSADNVAGIFLPGLQIAEGTELDFMFNPDIEKYSLSLKSSYVEYEKFFIANLDVESENRSDSLWLGVDAQDVYVSGFNMPDFRIEAGARLNHIDAAVSFDDTVGGLNALVSVAADLGRRPNGLPFMKLKFNPSYVADRDNKLDITADDIVYDSTRIEINDFAIRSGKQGLFVDGIISAQNDDSLHVVLRDASLDLLKPLIARTGFEIKGLLNGYADLASVKREPVIAAEVNMDSLRFDKYAVDPLKLTCNWDVGRARASVQLLSPTKDATLVKGYYRPSDGAYLAEVKMDDIPMSLLDTFLDGVVHGSRGEGNIDLELQGGKNSMIIDGAIDVAGLVTTIDFNAAEYRIDSMRIAFDRSVAAVKSAQLIDSEGHKAQLDLTLDVRSFANMKYDVLLLPEDLLVLNTTAQDNDVFYGHVYASGAVNVKGDKKGVNMDIVATTDDNSQFFMPLSGASDYSVADFVVFESAKPRVDTTDFLVRKKMMYERKMKHSTVKSDMNISMTLNVLPNMEFQLVIDPTVDNVLKARGNASLNINVNPKNNVFTMYGNYEITDGTYKLNFQNIIERQFTILQGSSIVWTGDPMDATLNISAAYRIKTSLTPLIGNVSGSSTNTQVDCIINLTDKLSQPDITFDVSVPNANTEYQSLVQSAFSTQEMMATQFFYLLAFGSFYSEGASTQNLNIGSSAGSMIGFDIITNQINNLLSNDDVSFDFRYRPKSETSSDEVELGISRELINDKLILEIEGNYDTGNNASASSDANRVSGGGTLTYIMDKSGNLVLKGYSRTIDRFDENQGLQENGLGIYYNKSFNTFKELWSNFVKKLSKKEKSEKASTDEDKETKQ